jgi:hypothetical protein
MKEVEEREKGFVDFHFNTFDALEKASQKIYKMCKRRDSNDITSFCLKPAYQKTKKFLCVFGRVRVSE